MQTKLKHSMKVQANEYTQHRVVQQLSSSDFVQLKNTAKLTKNQERLIDKYLIK
jgi:hypothetical protein